MLSFFTGHISDMGGRVDTVQFFLIYLMAFWFILCNAVLVYLMLKYRRRGKDDKVTPLKGNHLVEITWTVIPTILVIFIFVYGINVWTDMRTMPDDSESYVVDVRAQRWAWSFKYPDGRTTAGDLYVPVNQKIKLRMNSNDVLHSFFLPEFRVKEDVVPSMFTYLWFEGKKPGTYNIFCTEYCGKDHSQMLGKVHVLDIDTWERFENNLPLDPRDKPLTPLEAGEQLYVKRGCKGCHSSDGSAVLGPSFKGLYNRSGALQDGTSYVADDNYIMESIKYPNRKLVAGYPANQMPAFEGQLTEDDIANIIEYIKTLQE